MTTTPYFCPGCRFGGSVAHDEQAYPAHIASLIEGNHRENAPHCRADVREIQIGELAPDGEV